MEPIKIKGLDLKPEVVIKPTFEGSDLPEVSTVEEVPNLVAMAMEEDFLSDLQEDLTSILKRVEALDRTDNTIKAIGKLKGAIELLKD